MKSVNLAAFHIHLIVSVAELLVVRLHSFYFMLFFFMFVYFFVLLPYNSYFIFVFMYVKAMIKFSYFIYMILSLKQLYAHYMFAEVIT